MLRKTLSLVALFILSSTCWADGFYLGLGVGPDTGIFSQDASFKIKPPGMTTVVDVIDKQQKGAQGYFASLFAGYGFYFAPYRSCNKTIYLGAEVNFNGSSNETFAENVENINRTFARVTYRVDRSYGISVLPGLLVAPTTLLYGRLGYVRGRFISKTSDPTLANQTKWLSAFRYGLGLEQVVYQPLSVRVEYSQLNYNKTRFLYLNPLGISKNTSVSPKTNQFEFAVDYHFCWLT